MFALCFRVIMLVDDHELGGDRIRLGEVSYYGVGLIHIRVNWDGFVIQSANIQMKCMWWIAVKQKTQRVECTTQDFSPPLWGLLVALEA